MTKIRISPSLCPRCRSAVTAALFVSGVEQFRCANPECGTSGPLSEAVPQYEERS